MIGKVYAQAIRLASNTIFHSALAASDEWKDAVWANRTQVGCVRFCSLPWSSIVPRRYECLPPDAASEQALAPQFISLRFGDPAYCLLSGDCPMAVWKGADNGSQMGVFLQIQETEAVANIQIRANEYLVANLECGVFLIPSHSCGTVLERPVGINRIPPQEPEPGRVASLTPSEPAPLMADETQHEPAASVIAEPKTEPEPEMTKADDVQHDAVAPANTEPKADAEPEPLKMDEAQHEPVTAVEPEPKADAKPEPPEAEEAQHEAIAAVTGAEPDLHTAPPELHETQTPGGHTEEQDGS